MSVFVDTSALFAVLDADDRNHPSGAGVWSDLLSQAEALDTTNYVLVETFALVQRRLGVEAVSALARDVVPLLRVHWVDDVVHERAVAALLAAGRRRLSLVDCVSFEMMRSLGIRSCFAFDSHFEGQGLTTLP